MLKISIKERLKVRVLLLTLCLLLIPACGNQVSYNESDSAEIDVMLQTPFYFTFREGVIDEDVSQEDIDKEIARNQRFFTEILQKPVDEKLAYLEQELQKVIQRHEQGEDILWDKTFVETYVSKYYPNLYPTIHSQMEEDKAKRDAVQKGK